MDGRKKSFIRTILVFVLVAAAVCQTGMLWLDGSSSHNFFYYASSVLKTSQNSNNLYAIAPMKTAVGDGSSMFSIIYGSDEEIVKAGEAIISTAVSSSKGTFEQDIEWKELIKDRCVVYIYPFSVPVDEYFAGVGAKKTSLPNDFKTFENIIIIPSDDDMSADIYFVSNEKDFLIYNTEDVKISDFASEMAEKTAYNIDGISYISTAQSGFNIFGSNIFVAQWLSESMPYSRLNKVPAISNETGRGFETDVSSFFKNYSIKSITKDVAGTYMASDSTTVLKYYPDGILEYFDYSAVPDKATQTISSAYKAGIDFLENDTTIKTNYYLSDMRISSDGIVFCFDYSVNNVPVMISSNISLRSEIPHAIEMVVDNNRVKKLKRYAFNYFISDDTDFVDMDFLTAMNLAMESGIDANSIENIVLGYNDDSINPLSRCLLYWSVDTEDRIFKANAKKETASEETEFLIETEN